MSEGRQTSRRDFLRGKAAVEAVGDLASGIAAEQTPAVFRAKAGSHLVRIARRAMACEFEVLLNAGQYPQGTEAALAALDLVDELEEQLSVFRESSEASALNRSAHDGPVEVEPRLFALLERAAAIHRETGGAHDITAGPLSKVWGFYRRSGSVPTDAALTAAMASVGMQFVELDAARRTVRFLRPGMEINLGSIGKGYALDRAAETLEGAGVDDFLIHGGNSSVLARGSASGDAGWWVGVRHPLVAEQRLGEICLRNAALGTSGSGEQFFVHEGRRYSHVIDPRSGRPAEGMLSVTIRAPTSEQADALSTAMFVMGREAAVAYCREHAEMGAVIVSVGDGERLEVERCGVEDADWRGAE